MGCILRPGVKAWRDGVLPYTIAPEGFTAQALKNIELAIAHWTELTNWRIVERTNQRDYVTFRHAGSSSSPVGRQGGRQYISLANNVGFGGTAHEIGHAIGMHHEQNRADRDNRVVVLFDRITESARYNFRQESPERSCDHGPYDYSSIMHYSSKAFLSAKQFELGEGWTRVRPFQVGGAGFLLLLSQETGALRTHTLGHDFGIGREVERATVLTGWTTAEIFERRNRTYLLLVRERDGRLRIHRVNADGTLGRRVDDRTWSGGWSDAVVWHDGDDTFVLFVKERTGTAKVHRINVDGRLGREIDVQTWGPGIASTGVYDVRGRRFVATLRGADGALEIRPIAGGGAIGDVVHAADWSGGWTSMTFFRRSSRPLVLRSNEATGQSEIYGLTFGGRIGAKVDAHEGSEGWVPEPYVVDRRAFMMFVERTTGSAQIKMLGTTGTIGRDVRLTPPITIYAPEPIGQRRGLSAGDIAAANARIG